MLATADLVAFAAATDLARAREFYGTTLGLPVLEVNDFACVLDAHGTMLRTTPSGERVAWFTDPDGNTLSLTQFG